MKTDKDQNFNSQATREFNFISDNNVNLNQNSQFQFAIKHALSIYPTNSIYTFIPKNGCTTLRASVANANGFFSNETNTNEHINWIHNNTYSFSAEIKELVKAQYTFTILRCPFEKLASLFLDKFLDKTPVAWNYYRQSNNKHDLDLITFSDFIHCFIEKPSLINGDIHWKRQSDFLVYKEYDDYFNFNNFSVIKEVLNRKINLELIDTRKTTNHGTESYSKIEGDFSEYSVSDLKKLKESGKTPKTECIFNPELKNIVNKLYQLDFKIYNDKAMK